MTTDTSECVVLKEAQKTECLSNCDVYNAMQFRKFILDIRSKEEWLNKHLCNAIHITVPSKIKSNNQSMFDTKDIISLNKLECTFQRKFQYLRQQTEAMFIIYHSLSHLNQQCVNELKYVKQCILYDFPKANVYFLKDGYIEFEKQFPFLCVHSSKTGFF